MHPTLWQNIKADLQASTPQGPFKIWLEPLTDLSVGDGRLVLGCPNKFSLKWVLQHYDGTIKSAIARHSTEPVEVELTVAPAPSRTRSDGRGQPDLPYQPGRLLRPQAELDHRFTFDSFITGPANRFAHGAALELALGGGLATGALFLTADTGLGKSHLSQAIGLGLKQSDPRRRVMYLTAEDFTNQMVSAIRSGGAAQFKDRFRRRVDALILEDVQFLSGKEKTQVELSLTLESLISDGRKVVFTSSRPPGRIPGLRSDLASRLQTGVVAAIDSPDFDNRVRIVMAKAKAINLELGVQVAEELAEGIKTDVRRLESAVFGLAAKSRLMGRPITSDLAREVLGQAVVSGPDLDRIIQTTARKFNLPVKEMLSRSRLKRIVECRSVAIYLSRRLTDHSLAEIGRRFDRSHSTVVHAVDRVERAIHRQTGLGRKAEYLQTELERI